MAAAVFSKSLFDFLTLLEANNNREWFSENKEHYEQEVVAPVMTFIEACRSPLESIAPLLAVVPKKTGGSLMRVYRDTRFSKDKTPYKTNVGIQFRHERGRDVHAPGVYLHLEPSGCFMGVGVWHPDSESLRKIRQRLMEEPQSWREVVGGRAFRNQFQLAGDQLKRPPQGVDPKHPLIDDLRRKDFIAIKNLERSDITKPTFVKQFLKSVEVANPLNRFLCESLSLPY